jgi:TrmH family RNA methyltransferase
LTCRTGTHCRRHDRSPFTPVFLSLLDQVCVVLYEPQNPINIGAAIRAMKNMGVSQLRLVRGVAFDPYRVEGIAHGTMDLIERIERYDDFDAAVADCVTVAAFTARRRAAKWRIIEPRPMARELLGRAADGRVAIVFGREDHGLPNEIVDKAQLVVTIPTTEHASLNLAQALLIALYELHLEAGDATRVLPPARKETPPPTIDVLEDYYRVASESLETIEFFKARNAEQVMRSIRAITTRAAPDSRELSLLRAMAYEVINYVARMRGEPTPAQRPRRS